MDEELPFHRIIFFPDLELKFPRQDDTMDVLPTLFFVEAAIDHALRTQFLVFDWPMPVHLQLLEQKIPNKKFFDNVMGKAIAHNCAMAFSMDTAQTYGFTLEIWLQTKGHDFRQYTEYYLDVVRSEVKPVNLSIIYMLSFAIVLSTHAVAIGSVDLMNSLIWSVVHKLGERFPYEWIYESLHHWALTFIFRHNDIDGTWLFEEEIEEGLDEVKDEMNVGFQI